MSPQVRSQLQANTANKGRTLSLEPPLHSEKRYNLGVEARLLNQSDDKEFPSCTPPQKTAHQTEYV